MAETKSDARRSWPRLVLWGLVITFGVVYLNAMRERGIEPEASAPKPHADTATVESQAKGSGTASVAATPTDVGSGIATAQAETPTAEADAAPASTMDGPERRDPTPRPVTKPADSAGSVLPRRSPAAQPDRAPPQRGDTEEARAGQDPRDAVDRRRARLLAEYHALRQSVEAERQRIWAEMNRRARVTAWPYPYASRWAAPAAPPAFPRELPIRPPPAAWPGP